MDIEIQLMILQNDVFCFQNLGLGKSCKQSLLMQYVISYFVYDVLCCIQKQDLLILAIVTKIYNWRKNHLFYIFHVRVYHFSVYKCALQYSLILQNYVNVSARCK